MNRLLTPLPQAKILNQHHYLALTMGLAGLTLYGSLIPLDFQFVDVDVAMGRLGAFAVIDPTLPQARGDWVISVVLYALMSFQAMGFLAVDQRPRRAWEVAFLCFSFCALLGLVIEFLQCYFPPRTVSLNDLIVETLGSALGVFLWLAAGQRITHWGRQLAEVRGLTALTRLALPGYVFALVVAMLMPFDFVRNTDELATKISEGRDITLIPFANLARGVIPFVIKTTTNCLCFGILGLLTALSLEGIPKWRTWSVALLLGVGVGTTLEVGQLFVFSRSCDVTDILTGTMAVGAGWALGLMVEHRQQRVTRWWDTAPPQRRVAFLTAGFGLWIAALLVVNWSPLGNFTTNPLAFVADTEELPESGLRRMSWAPLVDYYWNDKYNALDQFAKKSLAFAPLGLLAAFFPTGRHGWEIVLVVTSLGLCCAAVVEMGQYFHPAHHPSVTDLLLGGVGASVGYGVVRHVLVALRTGPAQKGVIQ